MSAVDRETVVTARGVRTQFGRHVVHDGLDLDVFRGEILGVVGGSGTGKSVLLRALIGLKDISSGSVTLFGESLHDMPFEERRRLERRFGVLFQDGALFSSLTVAQNVQSVIREHLPVNDRLLNDLAALKVSIAGLPPDAGPKFPSELSGGMRKRAGLARALALDPELLFLDEPTAGLDPIGAARFDDLILNLRDSLGLTVFLVTHDVDSLIKLCDRIAVLAEKRVIATGTIDDLIAIDHPWIRDYFGGPRGRAAAREVRRAVV